MFQPRGSIQPFTSVSWCVGLAHPLQSCDVFSALRAWSLIICDWIVEFNFQIWQCCSGWRFDEPTDLTATSSRSLRLVQQVLKFQRSGIRRKCNLWINRNDDEVIFAGNKIQIVFTRWRKTYSRWLNLSKTINTMPIGLFIKSNGVWILFKSTIVEQSFNIISG